MSLNSLPLAAAADEAIYPGDLEPAAIARLQERLGEWLVTTPVVRCGERHAFGSRHAA